MNLQHAVDLYINVSENWVMVQRRRDAKVLRLKDGLSVKRIGHAVMEALEPGGRNTLPWQEAECEQTRVADEIEIVVVYRVNERTVVVTPLYEWVKAPDMVLEKRPTYVALGHAVLKQVAYVSAKRRHAGRSKH